MSDRKTPPRAPNGLGPRGRAFWRDVHATWELTRPELELLVESCRSLDQLDELRAVLERDGLLIAGSVGQQRVHPAVSQVNATRSALAKLLGQLGLPDLDGESLPSATTVRARRAAESRWSRQAGRRRGTA